MLTLDTATYLGPARAIEVDGKRTRVELPGGETAPARIAMPHRPAAGDELLVVRLGDGELYAIGILEGHGLHFEAETITLRAGKLDITANRIVEKARDVFRWVSDLFRIEARRMSTSVQADHHLRAGTVDVRAREDVNIDGKSINLG